MQQEHCTRQAAWGKRSPGWIPGTPQHSGSCMGSRLNLQACTIARGPQKAASSGFCALTLHDSLGRNMGRDPIWGPGVETRLLHQSLHHAPCHIPSRSRAFLRATERKGGRAGLVQGRAGTALPPEPGPSGRSRQRRRAAQCLPAGHPGVSRLCPLAQGTEPTDASVV